MRSVSSRIGTAGRQDVTRLRKANEVMEAASVPPEPKFGSHPLDSARSLQVRILPRFCPKLLQVLNELSVVPHPSLLRHAARGKQLVTATLPQGTTYR